MFTGEAGGGVVLLAVNVFAGRILPNGGGQPSPAALTGIADAISVDDGILPILTARCACRLQ